MAWSRRCREPYDDLEAVAFVGLMRACRRYDPGKGARISTFCWPYINGAIQHYLRDKGHLVRYPTLWRESWGRVSWLLGQEGATIESVSRELGIDRAELQEMASAMGQDRGVLNAEVAGGDALEALEDDLAEQLGPVDELVDAALRALHPPDRKVLTEWLENHRRRMVPQAQIRAFLGMCRRHLRGLRLVEHRQRNLLSRQTDPAVAGPRRRRLARGPQTATPAGVPDGWHERQLLLRDQQQQQLRDRQELQQAALQMQLLTPRQLAGRER